jgi:Tfp pilus assembly protein PilF
MAGPTLSRFEGCAVKVALAAVVLTLAVSAQASPQSQRLIGEGTALLAKGNTDGALAKFDAAAKADPNDAGAPYYQGAALNRLARHAEALPKLQAAQGKGLKTPGLDLEMGWALLGTNRFGDAIRRLRAYDAAKPGVGKTSELLGRAHMGLKQYDQAEACLKEAIRRDAGLTISSQFYLAMLAAARNDGAGVTGHLDRMAGAIEEMANVRGGPPGQPAAPDEDKPWNITLMLGSGYNSNALAGGDSGLPAGAPLPGGIRRDGTTFATMGLGTTYELIREDNDSLTVGYTLQSDLHGENDTHGADLLSNYWFAEYDHRFDDRLVGTVTVADEYVRVGRRPFLNQVMARGTLAYQCCEAAVVEGAYIYHNNEFLFGSPRRRQQDRDADAHTLMITCFVAVPETDLRTRCGYYHTYNRAEGSDFDYDGDAVFVFGAHPLPCDANVEVGYTRIWNDYHEPNSVAGPFGWAFSREDNVHVLSVEFTRPLSRGVTLFMRYEARWNGSNIPEYGYNQHVYTGGVLCEF